jgi:hypothetical protein
LGKIKNMVKGGPKNMKNFFKFTYQTGKPVRNHGKVVLLDKNRKWTLVEGVEYIIENPQMLELEKCIIVKGGKFLRIDEIAPTYQVSDGPYVNTGKKEISFSVRRTVVYHGEDISSEMDYENFTFGQTGGEAFYGFLPTENRQQVDDFRSYRGWISENQLLVLDGRQDFDARRGFRLVSEKESLVVETAGYGSAEEPKEVSVVKLQIQKYEPFFQEGFVIIGPKQIKKVTSRLGKLSLEESELPFSFKPVWKSPQMVVGKITIDGEEVEGLVKRPGDGTGSYLDAVMYLGLMEMPPPSDLSDDDINWLKSGGKICWVYEVTGPLLDLYKKRQEYPEPSSREGWFKIIPVIGYGGPFYLQDCFNNKQYSRLVEESALASPNY